MSPVKVNRADLHRGERLEGASQKRSETSPRPLSRCSGQHATGVQSMAPYFQQGANLKNQNAKLEKPTTIPIVVETCPSVDLPPQLLTRLIVFSMVDTGEAWRRQTC